MRCCPTSPFVVMPGLVPLLSGSGIRGGLCADGRDHLRLRRVTPELFRGPGLPRAEIRGLPRTPFRGQAPRFPPGARHPRADAFADRPTAAAPGMPLWTPEQVRGDGRGNRGGGGDNDGRCGRPPAPSRRRRHGGRCACSRRRGGGGHASVPRRSPVSGRMAWGGAGGSVSSAAASALAMAARVSGVPGRLPISICDR